MNRLLALLLVLLIGGSCAHTPSKPPTELLKKAAEGFHERIRWRDYPVAARYVIPERRKDFERARREQQDERDLTVTDYEIQEVEYSEDGYRATVTSRIEWMRLPSASARSATVTSEFVYREGAWLLERQFGGPFDGELP